MTYQHVKKYLSPCREIQLYGHAHFQMTARNDTTSVMSSGRQQDNRKWPDPHRATGRPKKGCTHRQVHPFCCSRPRPTTGKTHWSVKAGTSIGRINRVSV